MWILLIIWISGGLATIGILDGILEVEGGQVDISTRLIKFLMSWYAFGVLIGIMLCEIGKKKE